MFNPYHARPIGSEKFEKHLTALIIEGIETQKTVKEALPDYPIIPRAVPGDRSGRMDPLDECWNDLYTAVLSLALLDYLDAYAKKLKYADAYNPKEWVCFSQCAVLENEYFRLDEDRSALLDFVLEQINQYSIYQLKLREINKIRHRISMVAGWSGRGRTI